MPSLNHQRTLTTTPPLRVALAKARSKHYSDKERSPQGLKEASHETHRKKEEAPSSRLDCRREPNEGGALEACQTPPQCSHEQDKRASTIDDEQDGSLLHRQ